MPRPRLSLLLPLWAVALTAPQGTRAQEAEEAISKWQYAARAVDWEAVERLQDDVRDYQGAGAIGAYELRIQTNGLRFDAVVTAEIADASKLAELRGFDTTGATPKGDLRPRRAATTALLSSPLDAPPDDP